MSELYESVKDADVLMQTHFDLDSRIHTFQVRVREPYLQKLPMLNGENLIAEVDEYGIVLASEHFGGMSEKLPPESMALALMRLAHYVALEELENLGRPVTPNKGGADA